MAKISKKIIKKSFALAKNAWLLVIVSLLINLNFPHLTVAKGLDIPSGKTYENINTNKNLPFSTERKPYIVTKISVSAYNSQPNQTDSTPCITASGLDVCERNAEDIIATNYLHLPFGTKVRFPELFGDQIFIVHDRMNKKYTKTADIWMKDYNDAIAFGRQYTTIEIF